MENRNGLVYKTLNTLMLWFALILQFYISTRLYLEEGRFALLSWAPFPLMYLLYSLIRGAISGYYPYPFANAVKFGYTQVAINGVGVLLLFLAVGSVLNGIVRLYHKKS